MTTYLFKIETTEAWGGTGLEASDVHHALTSAFPSLSNRGAAVRVELVDPENPKSPDDGRQTYYHVRPGDGGTAEVLGVLGYAAAGSCQGEALARAVRSFEDDTSVAVSGGWEPDVWTVGSIVKVDPEGVITGEVTTEENDPPDLEIEVEARAPVWVSSERFTVKVPFVLGLARGVAVHGVASLIPREDGAPGYGRFGTPEQPTRWLDAQTLASIQERSDFARILDEIEAVCSAAVGTGILPA